ncbi:MAG: hypothetical protein JWP97_1069 [Labilithrix sp.]|nr:hypothetical protein [Labilithrix sp.]
MNRVSSLYRNILVASLACGLACTSLLGCAAEAGDETNDGTESSENDLRAVQGARVVAHSASGSFEGLRLVTSPGAGGPQDVPVVETGPGSGPQPEPWKGQGAKTIVASPRK